MSKLNMLALWLVCALVISSCASASRPVPTPCPVLPPIPENLLTPMTPDLQSKVREELFEPQRTEIGE